MTKKLFAIILIALISLGALAGCTKPTGTSPEATASPMVTETPVVTDAIETNLPDGENTEPPQAGGSTVPVAAASKTPKPTAVNTPKPNATANAKPTATTAPSVVQKPQRPKAVVKEIPIGPPMGVYGTREPLDLREKILLSTYVFSGTIISMTPFELSWTESNGNTWGPLEKTWIDVKINKEYNGKSPVDGDVVRIHYQSPLAWVFDNSVCLTENGEYVFVTQVINEQYLEYKSRLSHVEQPALNEYADVFLGAAWSSVFPINDGSVIVNKDYFAHDEAVMNQILPADSVKTDNLTTSDSLKAGDYFIALSRDVFDREFVELFKNPSKLPTLSTD